MIINDKMIFDVLCQIEMIFVLSLCFIIQMGLSKLNKGNVTTVI